MVLLLPAFFLILGVAWVLDQIFVEELDEHEDNASGVITRRQPALAGASAIGQQVMLLTRRNLPRRLPPTAQEGGA